MTSTRSRRRLVGGLALLRPVMGGGCLTNSTVTVDTSASTVFEDVSVDEPWTSRSLSTTATLTATVTTEQGVGELVVIAADGTSFDSVTLDAGQTSATLSVPSNPNATVLAVDTSNGTVVESQSVVTNGRRVLYSHSAPPPTVQYEETRGDAKTRSTGHSTSHSQVGR